ncbi:MAG: AmmeMemoRadiSam system radical SAM enzyme, partial [Bacteroidota bacterium]|nr:AmmeMemoRadiSam system radical SAM enzyme [Bacteroidota bacterium]
CKVRINIEGVLYTEVFGKVASLAIDPIEKKPLFHFYPGRQILSFGTNGCNLRCSFCQNYTISQHSGENAYYTRKMKPADIVELATRHKDNLGIAYTYNEPTVFYEFMIETAKLAQEKGLKNVMVTNGYINPKPLMELLPFIDAFNVDLKAFDDNFYRKVTGSSLAPVLESIKIIYNAGKHLELTNLVIPGENDDEEKFKEMLDWITKELSPSVPFHLSRYFPSYLYTEAPTPTSTLAHLFKLAHEKLEFVYVGNVSLEGKSDTFCPSCKHLLISRYRYQSEFFDLDESGNCKNCGTHVIDYL